MLLNHYFYYSHKSSSGFLSWEVAVRTVKHRSELLVVWDGNCDCGRPSAGVNLSLAAGFCHQNIIVHAKDDHVEKAWRDDHDEDKLQPTPRRK